MKNLKSNLEQSVTEVLTRQQLKNIIGGRTANNPPGTGGCLETGCNPQSPAPCGTGPCRCVVVMPDWGYCKS